MNISFLKTWIVPCLIVWVIVDKLYLKPGSAIPDGIRVISKCLMLFVPVVSGSLIVLYYSALPSQKKTILVHLMQLLLAINTIILLHANVVAIFYTLYHDTVQEYFNYAPNLTCSLVVQEQNVAVILNCLIAIVCFKIMAALMPNCYLSMNHNLARNITCITMAVSLVWEYFYYLIYYETLCTKHNIYNTQTFFGFTVDKNKVKEKPATLVYHVAAGLVIQFLKLFGQWGIKNFRKQLKARNHQVCPRQIKKYDKGRVEPQRSYKVFNTNNLDEKQTNEVIISTKKRVKDHIIVDERKGNPQKNEDIIVIEVNEVIYKPRNTITLVDDNINAVTSKKQEMANHHMIEIKWLDDEKNIVKDEIKGVREEINVEANGVVVEKNCGGSVPSPSTSRMKNVNGESGLTKVSMEVRTLPDLKINNLIPRIDVEEIRILESSKETTCTQHTPKPQLLKTDYVAWVGAFSLILTGVTVFINSENDTIIEMNGIISNIFFIVMPTYWILRSEEKTKFVKRRFIRFINR